MITPKQLNIFGQFGRRPFGELSFQDLKDLTKEHSHSVLQNALKAFTTEELVTFRKVGTTKLYKLNHNNNKIYAYLEIHFLEQLPRLVTKTLNIILSQIALKELFFSIIIFGSHADNTHQTTSDLDLAILCTSKKSKTQLQIALKKASLRTPINLDYHVFTKIEFQEMLAANYQNLAKELITKNIPIYQTEGFYRMILSMNYVNYSTLGT